MSSFREYITHHVIGNKNNDGKSYLLATSSIKHFARIFKREAIKHGEFYNIKLIREVKLVIVDDNGNISYCNV